MATLAWTPRTALISITMNSAFNITIHKAGETPISTIFEVILRTQEKKFTFTIILDREYHKDLTHKNVSPLHLIQDSILFLLERESPERIFPEFNLKEIAQYFPDYERTMQGMFIKP